MSLRMETRRLRKNLLLAAGICSFCPAALLAEQTNYSSGGVGGRWMNLPGSARSQAVAQASGSLADDINSILINPAGLGRLKSPQLMLSQNYWIEGSSMQYAAFGMPVFKSSGMAVGFRYANFGEVERISVDPSGFLKEEGTIRPYGMSVDLSWGQAFGKSLHLGLATHIAFQKLDTSRTTGFLGTLGALWKVPKTPMTLSTVLENVGSDLQGTSPVNIRLGGKYSADLESLGLHGKLNLLPEANFAVRDQRLPVISLGAEYWAAKILALRAGYQLGNEVVPKGLAVGLGVSYRGIGIDYAFNTASNGFSNTHLITLVAGLGGSKEAKESLASASNPRGATRAQNVESPSDESPRDVESPRGAQRALRERREPRTLKVPSDESPRDVESPKGAERALRERREPRTLKVPSDESPRDVESPRGATRAARDESPVGTSGLSPSAARLGLSTPQAPLDQPEAAKAMATAFQKNLERFNPVRENENTVLVRLPLHPETVYFKSGESVLSGLAQKEIIEISAVLEQYPKSTIWIGGHSDSVGSEYMNWVLSMRRAKAVSFALQEKGISKNRISKLVGFGESVPIADNITLEGRAANRRFELRIKFDGKDF